ncbi:hypothetical protein ISS30_10375 [bacterium]|nr:hypothetical protein [FCB group bacterium]MBL7192088.1 hypothetical protein [bacterium]
MISKKKVIFSLITILIIVGFVIAEGDPPGYGTLGPITPGQAMTVPENWDGQTAELKVWGTRGTGNCHQSENIWGQCSNLSVNFHPYFMNPGNFVGYDFDEIDRSYSTVFGLTYSYPGPPYSAICSNIYAKAYICDNPQE